MRIPFLPFIIILVICILIDAYLWIVIKKRCVKKWPLKVQLFSSLALYICLAAVMLIPHRTGSDTVLLSKMWALYAFFSVYIAKLFFIIIDAIGRFFRLFSPKPIKWVGKVAICASVAIFGVMWWGALINRFNININNVDLPVANLPRSFEGYKIVQISDLHTGTYGDRSSYLRKLVEKVNSLNPDVIVFTGDIVNRRTEEIVPHVSTLAKLSAPDGVLSILGNHDYGDYFDWDDFETKQADHIRLIKIEREQMNWTLLLNENKIIKRGNDSIAIIGVENVGDPPFKIYGSLKSAYPNYADSTMKVLLTHNPVHWSDSIAGRPDMNIALTLAGHTHAMQMEVAGVSPAVFRYRTWGGLYNDADSATMKGKKPHNLYVNIGIGTVGIPMRIGATPEVTVFTLHRAAK